VNHRRRRSIVVILALSVLALLASGRAARAAATCTGPHRPVIELLLDVQPPDLRIATTLAGHLTSEMATRGIDVCSGAAPPRRPVARVRLRVEHPLRGPVLAIIEVSDSITDKRIERTIDLSRIPADARPLAVATSTDELLRASWIELAMKDAPPPAMAPPPEVTAAVASALESPAPAAPRPAAELAVLEVGVSAQAATLSGTRTAIGGAAVGQWWASRHLALVVRLGADKGLARSSRDGTTHLDDLFVSVGVDWAITSRARAWGFDVLASGSVLGVRLAATPVAGAFAAPTDDWAVLAEAGGVAWRRFGKARVEGGLSALGVARATHASDQGQPVSAISGVGAQLTLGITFGL
jgi:hypothetical protein